MATVQTIKLPSATIVRRQDLTDDLFLLWLQPEAAFSFKAGLYVTIGAGGLERPYSIASAPYEPLLELFIEHVPPEHGGKLTPILHTHRVGDVLTMRPRAKGIFTLRADAVNHVMVGTVTGVAPYVSMIRQYVHDRANGVPGLERHRFFVMEGASHRDELVYDKELLARQAEHPGVIHFVGSISRPDPERDAGWAGPTGRINLHVEEYLERWALPKEGTVVYLCGHPGMIEDVKARLHPRGWKIEEERFWRP